MPKYNFLEKKFKKQLLSINNSLENSFNQIKNLKSSIKKLSLSKDNKLFLGLGVFIGKTLLEKNFAIVNCRNSKTRTGAEVVIKWKNKDLFNI